MFTPYIKGNENKLYISRTEVLQDGLIFFYMSFSYDQGPHTQIT